MTPRTTTPRTTTPRTTTARHRLPTAVTRVAVVLALALSNGCGDDGNDLGQERRVESGPTAPTNTGAPDSEPADDPDGEVDVVAGSVSAPSTSVMPSVEPSGVVVPVIALDNSFRPERVEIAVGDEIVWENRGLNEHNVLRVEGEGWGVEVEAFQPGDVYAHVFTEPGEYRYFCSIHGNEDIGMIGTVVVRG